MVCHDVKTYKLHKVNVILKLQHSLILRVQHFIKPVNNNNLFDMRTTEKSK